MGPLRDLQAIQAKQASQQYDSSTSALRGIPGIKACLYPEIGSAALLLIQPNLLPTLS